MLPRIASASTATRPASAPMLHIPPASGAASTPPATDRGSDSISSPARRQLATAAWSSRKMPMRAAAVYPRARSRPACAAAAFPNTSAWYSYGIGTAASR